TQAEIQRKRHPVFYGITFVVLVVVVVAFIGSGINGGISQREKYVLGKYGNHDIEPLRGSYSALNYFTEQIDTFGAQTEDAEQTPRIWREAFNNTLIHYAIIDVAEKSGYVVSKRRLDRGVTQHRQFQSEDGFDEKRYLDTTDMEKSQIKKLINETILHGQVMDDVLFSQLISTGEVEFYKSMTGTERKFAYVSYRYSDFPEEKVISYGNENKELFKEMRLSRILLTGVSAKDAETIRSEIENKVKSFEEMAKEKSRDIYAEKGGDMGSQYYYQILGFLENEDDVRQIYNLKKDELSSVIQNGENFEIYRSNSIVTEPDFAGEALLKTVREYIMKYQKNLIEEYSLELASAFAKKAEEVGFSQACTAMNLKPPYETEFFPINYLDVFTTKPVKAASPDAPSILSASRSEDFFIEAFSLEKDNVSKPIRLDDQYVVLQLLDEKKMTDSDWEAENAIFKTALSNYQSDFTMMQLMNSIYQIALKHYQQPSYVYQFLFSKVMARAEEKNIPYEYAFKVFLNKSNDFDKMIEDIKEKNAVDNFEETYRKLFRG
ncbi:MAG: SurA N-terminal domain-containing protein, partial [Spirochaetales bacterium]|nr:SurA N-terminal domain-containing protein [Spirochaetales bacterium]